MKNRIFYALLAVVLLSACGGEEHVIVETVYGDMVIRLRDDTPQHSENFIKLAREGYYDDLLFHRVMRNFMIQGGDPQSKDAPAGQLLGAGGPGYTLPAEFTGGIHIRREQ